MKYIVGLALVFLTVACNSNPSVDTEDIKSSSQIESNQNKFFGNTQGTTYAILCADNIQLTNREIDETLLQFDLALSSYIPNSILTHLNNASAGKFTYNDKHHYFNRCVKQSKAVYKITNGAFDPTVYPLVEGWGFMNNIEHIPDSLIIDSLLKLVGFQNNYHFSFSDSIQLTDSLITKTTPGAKLDFNAIAQGLSVDVICELLEKKGASNYFVEIGGEIRVKGKNENGDYWSIGIDKPIEGSSALTRELQEIIKVTNKAIATSGSYRKFYEKDGVKYSHTLNPETGYPVKHSLLSATVIANDCATADGLATAFMVMGPEKSIEFIKSNKVKGIELYLIFYNSKGRMETFSTVGFKELIIKD